MKVKVILASAAFAVLGSMASAATIELSSSVAEEDIATIPGQDFQTELGDAGATHLYSGPLTLTPSKPVKVTFSLVASESGFVNSLLVNGSKVITEVGNKSVGADFTTGAVDGKTFSFNFFGGDLASALSFEAFDASMGTTMTFTQADDEFGIFADSSEISALTTFYLALDDSGADNDDNHDDVIVRVDVAAVPLPASALLLMFGMGGFAGARTLGKRRSKKAQA